MELINFECFLIDVVIKASQSFDFLFSRFLLKCVMPWSYRETSIVVAQKTEYFFDYKFSERDAAGLPKKSLNSISVNSNIGFLFVFPFISLYIRSNFWDNVQLEWYKVQSVVLYNNLVNKLWCFLKFAKSFGFPVTMWPFFEFIRPFILLFP